MLSNGGDQYQNINVILDFELQLDVLSSKTMGKLTQTALTFVHLNMSERVLSKTQWKYHNFIRTKTIEKGVYSMPSAQRMPPQ